MVTINSEFLQSILPKVSGSRSDSRSDILREIEPHLDAILKEYEIDTPLRISHFLAQLAHESDSFCTTQEYASGSAYEGRKDLENTDPGDGRKYKGRGLIQLTGKANYRQMGKILDLPLELHPCIAAEPVISLMIACEYWKSRDINKAADTDNIEKVTKLVNGGLNGIEDRKQYYAKFKNCLNQTDFKEKITIVLKKGSQGDYVKKLQQILKDKGYSIKPDGDFGKNTDMVVKSFQKANGLNPDGIVGENTWKILT